jgi:hypothetical protein
MSSFPLELRHTTRHPSSGATALGAGLALRLRPPSHGRWVGKPGRPASASPQCTPLWPICRIPYRDNVLHACTRVYSFLARARCPTVCGPPAGLRRMADCLVEVSACMRKISAVACTTISGPIGFAGSANQGVRSALLFHPVAPV